MPTLLQYFFCCCHKMSHFSQLLDVSTVYLVSHSTSTFLPAPLYYFSFSNTYYTYLYISPYLWLLLATNNSLLPTLSSFIFLHILLLVCHSIIRLFPPLAPHPLVYKLSSLSVPNLLLSAILLLFLFFYYIYFRL